MYDYFAWELSRAGKSGKKLVRITLLAQQEYLYCEGLPGAWYTLTQPTALI